jgi:hypothetical protein
VSTVHVVAKGEHIAQIARKYGFENYTPLWEHPKNAELKALRATPFVLDVGDEIFIPDRVLLVFNRTTDASHDFTVSVDKLALHLRFLGPDTKPRPSQEVTIEVDPPETPTASVQRVQKLTTDGDGKVSVEINKSALVANVVVAKFDFAVHIGGLRPASSEEGLAQRLNNLGYFVPPPEDRDDDEVQSAIEEFQCDNGLKVTGKAEDVQSKIEELYGS